MAERANFSKISALIVDNDHYSTKILCQILRGFGLNQFQVADTAAGAREILLKGNIDLVICETCLPDDKAGELVRWMRRLPSGQTRFTPVIMLSGYTHMPNVVAARDSGANTVVRKPVSPKVLYDHIAWSTGQDRAFVETGEFIGPDRRFKYTEPLDGAGRRDGDHSAAISKVTESDVTEDQQDATVKPAQASVE